MVEAWRGVAKCISRSPCCMSMLVALCCNAAGQVAQKIKPGGPLLSRLVLLLLRTRRPGMQVPSGLLAGSQRPTAAAQNCHAALEGLWNAKECVSVPTCVRTASTPRPSCATALSFSTALSALSLICGKSVCCSHPVIWVARLSVLRASADNALRSFSSTSKNVASLAMAC